MRRIAIVMQNMACGGEANSLNQIYETECYCGFIAMKKVKENKPICFFGLDCEKIFVILHCGNAVFHKDHVQRHTYRCADIGSYGADRNAVYTTDTEQGPLACIFYRNRSCAFRPVLLPARRSRACFDNRFYRVAP